jgi:excisionase family DNA binding protein
MSNLIDVKAAAQRLGVSTFLIYRLTAAKKLPHFRINTAVRFREEDLEKWLLEQARCPAAADDGHALAAAR